MQSQFTNQTCHPQIEIPIHTSKWPGAFNIKLHLCQTLIVIPRPICEPVITNRSNCNFPQTLMSNSILLFFLLRYPNNSKENTSSVDYENDYPILKPTIMIQNKYKSREIVNCKSFVVKTSPYDLISTIRLVDNPKSIIKLITHNKLEHPISCSLQSKLPDFNINYKASDLQNVFGYRTKNMQQPSTSRSNTKPIRPLMSKLTPLNTKSPSFDINICSINKNHAKFKNLKTFSKPMIITIHVSTIV